MLKPQTKDKEKYRVFFNPDSAWSLVYEDSKGKINFVFEPGSEEKSVFLNPTVLIEKEIVHVAESKDKRAKVGFERTKEYLIECGYKIETS